MGIKFERRKFFDGNVNGERRMREVQENKKDPLPQKLPSKNDSP